MVVRSGGALAVIEAHQRPSQRLNIDKHFHRSQQDDDDKNGACVAKKQIEHKTRTLKTHSQNTPLKTIFNLRKVCETQRIYIWTRKVRRAPLFVNHQQQQLHYALYFGKHQRLVEWFEWKRVKTLHMRTQNVFENRFIQVYFLVVNCVIVRCPSCHRRCLRSATEHRSSLSRIDVVFGVIGGRGDERLCVFIYLMD